MWHIQDLFETVGPAIDGIKFVGGSPHVMTRSSVIELIEISHGRIVYVCESGLLQHALAQVPIMLVVVARGGSTLVQITWPRSGMSAKCTSSGSRAGAADFPEHLQCFATTCQLPNNAGETIMGDTVASYQPLLFAQLHARSCSLLAGQQHMALVT
jgi:(2R)-phospho-3-sulfolactate synthase (ComA)